MFTVVNGSNNCIERLLYRISYAADDDTGLYVIDGAHCAWADIGRARVLVWTGKK